MPCKHKVLSSILSAGYGTFMILAFINKEVRGSDKSPRCPVEIAQLGEQMHFKHQVIGSNPVLDSSAY